MNSNQKIEQLMFKTMSCLKIIRANITSTMMLLMSYFFFLITSTKSLSNTAFTNYVPGDPGSPVSSKRSVPKNFDIRNAPW